MLHINIINQDLKAVKFIKRRFKISKIILIRKCGAYK